MTQIMDAVDRALHEVDHLRKFLKRKHTAQVWAAEERSIVKATAHAWFKVHQAPIASYTNSTTFQSVCSRYRELLEAGDHATSRATYDALLKKLREMLISLRSEGVSGLLVPTSTSDQPPDFAPLTNDVDMQTILTERWQECLKCLSAKAPLSATVMMGGLLEALLLGRVNREANQAPIFKAKAAPKDKHRQPQPLKEWTLHHFIEVAHELKWISVSAKDVGVVLRDYRNYVHPFKQLRHGVHLSPEDAQLLWEVSKAVSRQVVKSASP